MLKYLDSNTYYDAIIDTRPDVLPIFEDSNRFDLDANTVYPTWQSSMEISGGQIGMCDVFQMMSKHVYDVYCERYKSLAISTTLNNHVDLRNFYIENAIQVKSLSIYKKAGKILRPCHIDHMDRLVQIPFDYTFYNDERNKWYDMSYRDKVMLLDKYNISLEDYSESKHIYGITK
jgi:hypothetical protein